MTEKKQRIQDVITVINTTSIEPETEVIEQLVKKLQKLGRTSCGYLSLTRKSGNFLITAETNTTTKENIKVTIREELKNS
jgi:hypothetical protein